MQEIFLERGYGSKIVSDKNAQNLYFFYEVRKVK